MRTVTWTANPGTRIGPGEFLDFPLSLGPLPTGVDEFALPAVQTYDDGEVVAWDQPMNPDGSEPERPAPTVDPRPRQRPRASAGRAPRRSRPPRPQIRGRRRQPTAPPAGSPAPACSSARSASVSVAVPAARPAHELGVGQPTSDRHGRRAAQRTRSPMTRVAPAARSPPPSPPASPCFSARRPAFAHARLESSDPADGSSVRPRPDTVSLTFSDDIQAEFASITLVGPDGTNYQTGEVSAAGGSVTTSVSPLGPAGAYTIGYRVVSDDGHPVQGKVAFTLTPRARGRQRRPPPRPRPQRQPDRTPRNPRHHGRSHQQANSARQQPDTPVWPWILGAVILVGAGAVVALRLGRRS